MDEIEVTAAARQLIEIYGIKGAMDEARRRSVERSRKADVEGQSLWSRVADAVEGVVDSAGRSVASWTVRQSG